MTAETLRIHPDEPEPELIQLVANSLNAGNVVALPTDTFYGLAVDPVNLRAVDRIYEIKTRARHKPLSLLIAEVAQAYELARSARHRLRSPRRKVLARTAHHHRQGRW